MTETDDIVAELHGAAADANLELDDARDCLDEAAAHITRLEERCAALTGQVEAGAAEVERLRSSLAACARHTGGYADGATTDFLTHVPEQVRLHVERLRAEPPGIVTRAIEIHHRAEAAEARAEALQAEVERLREIVASFVAMVEDSMSGTTHPEVGRFVPGVTDLELRPDGSLKLSDARAALQPQEPKP